MSLKGFLSPSFVAVCIVGFGFPSIIILSLMFWLLFAFDNSVTEIVVLICICGAMLGCVVLTLYLSRRMFIRFRIDDESICSLMFGRVLCKICRKEVGYYIRIKQYERYGHSTEFIILSNEPFDYQMSNRQMRILGGYDTKKQIAIPINDKTLPHLSLHSWICLGKITPSVWSRFLRK